MAVLETPQRSCSHVKLVRWGMCMSSPWACSRCCWIWGGWGESREGEATFAALTGLVFKEVWLDGRRDKNEPLRTVEEQQLHPGHLFLLASCKNVGCFHCLDLLSNLMRGTIPVSFGSRTHLRQNGSSAMKQLYFLFSTLL
ncbi:uncharacterized protein [Aegilops tauschii subsp. strangulata]|uniref:uncharacterized protein n=1 Tax=Aegilops tauschii subsp. strangulata TaxID=200361 RepID=UPI001ABC53DE|nr:uncharacterized protein LOC109766024 isoform X1 [Aegilops tauschii subsp. strangulata]